MCCIIHLHHLHPFTTTKIYSGYSLNIILFSKQPLEIQCNIYNIKTLIRQFRNISNISAALIDFKLKLIIVMTLQPLKTFQQLVSLDFLNNSYMQLLPAFSN